MLDLIYHNKEQEPRLKRAAEGSLASVPSREFHAGRAEAPAGGRRAVRALLGAAGTTRDHRQPRARVDRRCCPRGATAGPGADLASACGDVNDVDHAHGDLNGTPST